ncbi:glycoside hydrolase family 3 protein [Listeria sp. PSOL-1]|uniref:glycoside hydrolase family 3 protein n=1 Tax=Listeria sp. PSOL-1 TaxID=1844999 RepID=UPI0013D13066|nr:glycoside hydrolase family 3 N-terminal domain-containing protein [Listeria sp. PSOL-1]
MYDDHQINHQIEQMTLTEKIGQMFISRTVINQEKMCSDIATYHLGGLVLYDEDLTGENSTTLKEKITKFQLNAKIPLLIGIDQEGGMVSRLTNHPAIIGEETFSSPQEIYNEAGINGTVTEAKKVAALLRDLLINWNFAPVADVTPMTSSYIYKRTLGQDYHVTADYIKKVVPAWQKHVAATLKHFPGYGSAIDTHQDFAINNKALIQLEKQDLLPFKAGIVSGVSAIMVSHVLFEKMDSEYPASLSPKIITDLLRKKLGFNGVIITDSLDMEAIVKFSLKHPTVPTDMMAILAGADCIMNNDYESAIPLIKKAVQKKQITETEIDQHVFRILKLKSTLGVMIL